MGTQITRHEGIESSGGKELRILNRSKSPDECSPHSHTLFLKIHFSIIFQVASLPFRFSGENLVIFHLFMF